VVGYQCFGVPCCVLLQGEVTGGGKMAYLQAYSAGRLPIGSGEVGIDQQPVLQAF